MTTAPANGPTPHNPFIGKVMGGRYQVDRLIGRGGMGLVYLGREILNDRELVLKMLAPHWAHDAHAVARFEREGKRLSELRHPNIVELFDIGHQDDHPYIVMEYIRGVPLRKLLTKKGRLDPATFLPIAAQLLDAVAYAHGKGVMLRDIKPSNVMLCERDGKANVVKVLDFGLAKMVEGDDVDVTKTNVIGTAGFLAPELIRGDDADVRVDVYALSIMFFIMLTGTSPILGENDGAILYNHVHGTPKQFSDVLPTGAELPSQALQDLIYRCMSKDPTERPANAGEMATLLRTCAEASAFELPKVTDESSEDVERYWQRKFEGAGLDNDDPSSSLWTRPRLEKLLEGDAEQAESARASNDDTPEADAPKPISQPEPGRPRARPPQPSAAIRAKTSGRVREPTRVGLPAVAEADESAASEPPPPPPPKRRPKPAKTAASSNMARSVPPGPPPRRNTLPAGSASTPSLGASPAPKSKSGDAPAVTKVPKPKPQPVEAPSPLLSDDPVGPLHIELEEAPPRKRTRKPRTTRPIANLPDLETPKLDAPGRTAPPIAPPGPSVGPKPKPKPEPEPKQELGRASEPTPAPRPKEAAGAAAVLSPAEPAATPEKRGIGAVLAVAVAAAVLIAGGVTWLALSGDDDAPKTAASGATESKEAAGAGTPKKADDTPADVAAVAVEPDTKVDPDAPGTLRIEGPPGGIAYVNDERAGAVPVQKSFAPGLYSVRVEAKGFEPWEAEVQLQPDGSAKLVAAMEEKLPGRATKTKPRSGKSGKSGKSSAKPAGGSSTPSTKKKDPPPAPKKDDDVFMKRGDKKDDGIFLPVGK